MENTRKVFFEDTRPEWFVAVGSGNQDWVGPLTASDIYQKVVDQQITLAHYVWKPGKAGWERICDLKEFQAAVPSVPSKSVQSEIKKSSGPPAIKAGPKKTAKAPPPIESVNPKIWYLHYNDTQFGPFSEEEILRFIKVKKLNARVHAWKDGMENWQRLGAVDAFAEALEEKSGKVKKPTKETKESKEDERRRAPRTPMVARILVSDSSSVSAAMCRDVSIGGMQVLTDQPPGEVGAKIKLNVSPAGSGKRAEFSPFVAEGVVVRLLEDGRGFSFRFTKLSDSARMAIEEYIRRAGD